MFAAVARRVRGDGKPLLLRCSSDLAVEADVRDHRLAAVGRRVLDDEVEQAPGFREMGGVAGRLPEEEAGLDRIVQTDLAFVRCECRDRRRDVAARKPRKLRRREEFDVG